MLRTTILSPTWWISTFISTLVVMCFIVLIKKMTVNVPVLGTITQEV